MTLLAYSTIQMNLANAQFAVVSLEQSLAEQRIALQTLIGPWDGYNASAHGIRMGRYETVEK